MVTPNAWINGSGDASGWGAEVTESKWAGGDNSSVARPPAHDRRAGFNRQVDPPRFSLGFGEPPEPKIGNRFQNHSHPHGSDADWEPPRRAGFGEGPGASRQHMSFGREPLGGHRPRFSNNNNGFPRPGASSFVPVDQSVEELYEEDHENVQDDQWDTDDIVFENGSEPHDFKPALTWKEADFPAQLAANIERCGYPRPRKIQAYAMPLVEHDYDIMGQAETGSGKSAAFLLPIIKDCMLKPKKDDLLPGAPTAIVICPTRELVVQLYDQGRKFANGCNVHVQRAYGEYRVAENARQIRMGCDILIATVGRLKHFIENETVKFDNLRYLVLDEADNLIETNHFDGIIQIIRCPDFPKNNNRQTLLFSATFSNEVELIASKILRADRKVVISNNKKTSANTKIKQEFREVKRQAKTMELLKILQKEHEETGTNKRTIIFVQTKRQTDVIAAFLTMNKVRATTIHGDRSQQLREEALRDFKDKTRILVATDVCARGLDIRDLDHVINYDLPDDKLTYVHRIGRSGRTRAGLATSFYDPAGNDSHIASELIKAAMEAKQKVPKSLAEEVGELSLEDAQ